MRLFWKTVLIAAISLGGYWLYKKSKRTSEIKEVQSEPEEGNKTTPQSSVERSNKAKQDGVDADEQIIERLTEIDSVISRVAENLVQRGIKNKEALMKLSEEELRLVKGIGPKRAAKILKLK